MQKYLVQVRVGIVASKEIRAESLEDAITRGREIKAEEIIATRRGWAWEWDDCLDVTGAFDA